MYDSDEELEMPDEDEYYDDYDGTEKDDSINIGKTFLIPRVKPLGYNIDIFGSDMLASRNKVSQRTVRILISYQLVGPAFVRKIGKERYIEDMRLFSEGRSVAMRFALDCAPSWPCMIRPHQVLSSLVESP